MKGTAGATQLGATIGTERLSATMSSSDVIREVEGPDGSLCVRRHPDPRLGLYQIIKTKEQANVIEFNRRWDTDEEAKRYADEVEALIVGDGPEPKRRTG